MTTLPEIHYNCRNSRYPDKMKNIERIPVPDEKVRWDVKWDAYSPPEYTSEHVKGKEWADPDINDPDFLPKWNSIDGNVNRVSYVLRYQIVDGVPLNPVGRTGLKGRGLLGKWGPNHAVDPIVTRWKMVDEKHERHKASGKRILQFVAIMRRDNGAWALPGGMVDAGENINTSLKREFMEETLNIDEKNAEEKEELRKQIEILFKNGEIMYKGYVDDPRNTDNAWIETTAVHFHDENRESVGTLPLEAGSDAKVVRWMNVDRDLKLYASHSHFVERVAKKMNAHW